MIASWLWRRSMWCHRHGFRLGTRFFKTLILFGFVAILEPEVELEGHVNLAHRPGRGDPWLDQDRRLGTDLAGRHDRGVRRQGLARVGVRIGRGGVIGAHAIVVCPKGRTLTIGDEAVVAAGAIVVDDVPAGGLVLPQPSRVIPRA